MAAKRYVGLTRLIYNMQKKEENVANFIKITLKLSDKFAFSLTDTWRMDSASSTILFIPIQNI